jgi:ribosomal protein L11 methylase PrmA
MPHLYEIAFTLPPALRQPVAALLYHLRDLASQDRDGDIVVWVGARGEADRLISEVQAQHPEAHATTTRVPVTWGAATATAPTLLGQGFAVCAPGDVAPVGRQAIVIEPGLGFGHGDHPTTAITAQALERIYAAQQPRTVLDAGTGSGVLGLMAACLGATVHAFDVDDAAVAAAQRNAQATDVAQRFTASTQAPSSAVFDLVVANIHAGPLLALAPTLAPCVGRTLLLSGVRARTAPAVLAAYGAHGLRVVRQDVMQGWLAIELSR